MSKQENKMTREQARAILHQLQGGLKMTEQERITVKVAIDTLYMTAPEAPKQEAIGPKAVP